MRRALGAVACTVVFLMGLTAATASATTSGGGTQRWAAMYDGGGPAVGFDVAASPDGSTVFVTGTTGFGSAGHLGTLAYAASSGARKWSAEFPGQDRPDFARGHALAVSPDGSMLFVTGAESCQQCGDASYEGFVTIAYDTASGDRLWVARHAAMGQGTSIATSPDGSMVFVYGADAGGAKTDIVAYAAETGDRLWGTHTPDAPVYGPGGLSVSPDGTTLFAIGTAPSGDTDCYATGGYHTAAYATSDGTPRWSSSFKHEPVTSYCGTATKLSLSPDGSRVFVTGYGGVLHGKVDLQQAGTVAYDAATGAQVWATYDDTIQVVGGDTVLDLEVSPDGSQVLVMGSDCAQYPSCPFGTAAYDATTGARTWVSRYDAGGRSYPNDLAVSADGTTVFETGQESMPCFAPCDTAQTDAPLVAYDAATGDERWVTNYPDNVGMALAVAPTGASVYLAGSFTSAADAAGRRVAGRAGTATSCSSQCGYSTARYNTGPGPGTFQEHDPTMAYGGWNSFFDGGALGGAYRASREAGDTATFTTPKAASVAWITHEGPDQGKARVSIDGHPQGVYDLYSPVPARRSVEFDGLDRAHHTVKVRVLGRKSASSRGTAVAVDGFKVKVGTGITQEFSANVRYDAWTGRSRSTASGGSIRVSGSSAARASLDFRGRSITWLTATGPAYGRARVVIDGSGRTVDLYRRAQSWKVPITVSGLSRGRHHITVRPLGTKDPGSGSKDVVVDAFVVRSR